MIDEQTSLVTYKSYTKASIKKDVIRQRNNILTDLIEDMCSEIGQETIHEVKQVV
jgi:hypothetical protein